MRSGHRHDVVKVVAVAAIAATLCAKSRAEAQQQSQVALAAGVATDQRGVRSNALTLAPGVVFAPTAGAMLSLGANVTRFAAGAWSYGGGAAYSVRRVMVGPLVASVDASASASRLQGDGSAAAFASGELLPSLELTTGPLTIFGGLRGATGYSTQELTAPSLPPLGGGETSRLRRAGAGPTFGAALTFAPSPQRTIHLGAREDRLRVSGVTTADRAVTAGVATDAVSIAAAVGRRYGTDQRADFGNLNLSVALRGDLSLDASAGRYASNRLMDTPGGEYMSVGLSFRFGASSARPDSPGPRVRGAPVVAPGATRLAIAAPDAVRVDVAGDFSEWTPVATTRGANGVWYADLRIAPGQYRYAFRVNGREWRVPHGATAVDDGFGGKSAWLTVARP